MYFIIIPAIKIQKRNVTFTNKFVNSLAAESVY